MPGQLPSALSFSYDLTVTPPPLSQAPVNVLILMHGLGDERLPFTNLGRQLQLPETVCISLQALTPLPLGLGGFHWGDDILIDQSSGDIDCDSGFDKSRQALHQIIDILIKDYAYQPREILFLGFGQGGMAALNATRSFPKELGGIISIGGPLSSTSTPDPHPSLRSKTPVLVIGGASQTLITSEAIAELQRVFEFVETRKWRRPGDTMPKDRDEMIPIMQFFARRLRSRAGLPAGSVELG